VADFPEALDEALSAHYSVQDAFASPIQSKRGFQARTRALEKAYGSKAAAARAAGIDPNTWYRWQKGKQAPGGPSLARVAAAHMALLRAAKVKRRGYPSQIDIKATVACESVMPGKKPKSLRYNSGGPNAAYRWFCADRLTASQLRDVVNAWAAGKSPDDVAALLRDEIERAYPGRFDFEGNDVIVNIHP
jgi:hypothetical protein